MQLINTNIMGGVFGTLILIVIAVICFMAFLASTNDVPKSLMASSFIAAILGVMLRALNLIPNLAMFIFIIGAALVTAFNMRKA